MHRRLSYWLAQHRPTSGSSHTFICMGAHPRVCVNVCLHRCRSTWWAYMHVFTQVWEHMMGLCAYTCVYMYLHKCGCTWCTRACMCVCVHVYVCLHSCRCTWWAHECMCVCTCVHACVCVCKSKQNNTNRTLLCSMQNFKSSFTLKQVCAGHGRQSL